MSKAEARRRAQAAFHLAVAAQTLESYGYSARLSKQLLEIADEIKNNTPKGSNP